MVVFSGKNAEEKLAWALGFTSQFPSSVPDKSVAVVGYNGKDDISVFTRGYPAEVDEDGNYEIGDYEQTQALSLEDGLIPDNVLENTDGVHIGSSVEAIPVETLQYIREMYSGVISLNVQEYVKKDEQCKDIVRIAGQVDIIKMGQAEAESVSGQQDLYKAMDWLENVMQISNDDIVLVVKQRDGSYIVSYQDQNERYRVELPSLGSEALVSPIRAENTYGAAFLNGYLKTNRNALRSAAYASIMSSLAGMSDEPFKYDKELATIRTREYTALARSIQPQLVEKEQLRAEGR